MRKTVVMCVCHNISFQEIQRKANHQNLTTISELKAKKICSNGCQMCVPYVERMLRTGETEFYPGQV